MTRPHPSALVTTRNLVAVVALAGSLGLSACGSSSSSSTTSAAATSSVTTSATGSATGTGSTTPSDTSSATVSTSSAPATTASASTSASKAASATASASATRKAGTYTMAQVATHKTSSSCWSVINGNVYNLTGWISKHPGGADKILAICGKNGTAAFEAQHSTDTRPKQILATYKIGTLAK